MRNRQKHIVASSMLLFLLLLSGCHLSEKAEQPEFPKEYENAASGEIASGSSLSLAWDNEKYCILLTQKETGKVWSSIPYEFYLGEGTDEDMESPIYIQYVDSASMLTVLDKGYTDCIGNGTVASEMTENGIRVTYYFENAGISVPVLYELREDALAVTVDFENVQEGANKLLSVSVAPFLCSVQNDSEDSYLTIPSGSGALMYTDVRQEGVRTWTGEIYGADATRLIPEELMDTENVRLPFFGIKEGEDALLAIVEQGDEGAYLTANAGNGDNGYSNAYVSFYARGYDVSESQTAWALSDVYRTEDTIQVKKTTVAFYPLTKDEANYTGMAKRYREYLIEQDILKKQDEETAQYALYITGGAQVKELVAGIPIKKTKALTTFQQAQKIVEEMQKLTGSTPTVQLKGFGASGLDAGKVAGGFSFASVFGTRKQRVELENYCETQGITLYTDFDFVYFTKNGVGLNTLLSPAKTASSRKMKTYPKDKALWHFDEDMTGSYLTGRKYLSDLTERLLHTAEEKGISGVSLATLGQIAYSDYSDTKYSVRGNMALDVQKIITQIQTQNIPVATEAANIYAAAVSDSVFEVPMDNGGFIDIDCDVPLYQMVLGGYVPLYSTAINTASNYKEAVAKAVSGGTNLGFSVVGEYDNAFATTVYKDLHMCSYKGNQEMMTEVLAKCTDYYDAIKGQNITAYEYLSDTVSKTTFSNGVVVYTNHGDDTVVSPLGELGAYEFTFTSEGN